MNDEYDYVPANPVPWFKDRRLWLVLAIGFIFVMALRA